MAAQMQLRGQAMRRVEKAHPMQSSQEAEDNLLARAAKRQACGPDIPSSKQKTLRVVVRETIRAPACRPNRRVDTFVECRSREVASDPKWDGSMTVRIWRRTVTLGGWRGERVGEAINPGPPQSKSTVMGRTRSQTARMLATQVEVDDQSRSRSPVRIPPTCVDVSSSPRSSLFDGLEEDLGQEFVSPSVAVVIVSPNTTTDNGLVAHVRDAGF